MEKIWLNNYPEGIPHDVDLNQFSSVVDVLETSCKRFADLPAYTNLGHTLSYRDMDDMTKDFAAYLQNVLGLSKGDRVAVMMPNLLQYPVAIFGILRAGMVVVNVNPLYTARELEHQLKDAGAKAIVIFESAIPTLSEVIDKTPVEHVITTLPGDLLPFPKKLLVNLVVKYIKKIIPPWSLPKTIKYSDVLANGSLHDFHTEQMTHDDVAFLQYTGGTTGLSKGATLTHGNIVANLQQATAWISMVCEDGKETIITALPLYHIFALTANCLSFMKLGGHNILITDPRDIPGFVQELSKHRFTAFTGVNTLFNGLLNNSEFARLNFSDLKLTLGGGAAVQKAVSKRWKEVTGKTLSEAYGLTETSPAASMNPLDLREHNGSIGFPLPSTEFSIRDDDGKELGEGEPGELCIKGPQVMQGYWNKPEENKKVFTDDGFLKTGDVAQYDADGFFYIVDRKKDMILVSGFNVFPNEIEAVVAQHPGVLECAVIGVPDDKTGEAIKVFAVKKDPNVSAQDIREFCKNELTGYKVPKQVEFRDELPKSNVGKILRKDLR